MEAGLEELGEDHYFIVPRERQLVISRRTCVFLPDETTGLHVMKESLVCKAFREFAAERRTPGGRASARNLGRGGHWSHQPTRRSRPGKTNELEAPGEVGSSKATQLTRAAGPEEGEN